MIPKNFEKRLLLAIVALTVVIVFRLGIVGSETGNWRGFWYSVLHVLVVAAATYYFLRDVPGVVASHDKRSE
jgi:hypothetical protein